MQRFLRYLAALTILVLVGASVATVDAAPGKSITGFIASHGNGNGGGNGNGNADDEETTSSPGNSGNANGHANDNANQGAANADDHGNNGNQGAKNADDEGNQANSSAEGDDENAGDENGKGKGGKSDEGDQATPVATDHKVMVCHLTGSASNPAHVIVIDTHAVPAHEAKGDFVVESEDECVAPAASPTEPPASPTAEPGTPTASPIASPTET
jgi:hypothetical protein